MRNITRWFRNPKVVKQKTLNWRNLNFSVKTLREKKVATSSSFIQMQWWIIIKPERTVYFIYEHLFYFLFIDRLMMFTFMEFPSAPSKNVFFRMNFVDGEVHEKEQWVDLRRNRTWNLWEIAKNSKELVERSLKNREIKILGFVFGKQEEVKKLKLETMNEKRREFSWHNRE